MVKESYFISKIFQGVSVLQPRRFDKRIIQVSGEYCRRLDYLNKKSLMFLIDETQLAKPVFKMELVKVICCKVDSVISGIFINFFFSLSHY